MNAGKTLFAQVMEFVPWTSFARIAERYSGNAGMRTLSGGPGATQVQGPRLARTGREWNHGPSRPQCNEGPSRFSLRLAGSAQTRVMRAGSEARLSPWRLFLTFPVPAVISARSSPA